MAYIEDFQKETARLYLQEFLDSYNNTVGHLPGKFCPICKNKGSIRKIVNGTIIDDPCECMKGRDSEIRVQESGLGGRTKKCTFTTYKVVEKWQHSIRDLAYKSQYGGNGFFIGGKPGSGKTHICIALMNEFMSRGKNCKYVAWQDLVSTLKQDEFEHSEEFCDTMDKLKKADVLFIDDLFRTDITNADKRLLFSIIDYRYNQVEAGFKTFTIISSEKFLDEIKEIDEAIGRRIEALTEGYAVNVPREERYKYKK